MAYPRHSSIRCLCVCEKQQFRTHHGRPIRRLPVRETATALLGSFIAVLRFKAPQLRMCLIHSTTNEKSKINKKKLKSKLFLEMLTNAFHLFTSLFRARFECLWTYLMFEVKFHQFLEKFYKFRTRNIWPFHWSCARIETLFTCCAFRVYCANYWNCSSKQFLNLHVPCVLRFESERSGHTSYGFILSQKWANEWTRIRSDWNDKHHILYDIHLINRTKCSICSKWFKNCSEFMVTHSFNLNFRVARLVEHLIFLFFKKNKKKRTKEKRSKFDQTN